MAAAADNAISVWNAILFLFLGWLLGLVGPIIVDAIKKRHRSVEIRKAIVAELDEARLRLCGTVYLIESRFGTYDRKLLEWILPILESYSGPNPGARMAELIRKHLTLDDAQLALAAHHLKASADGGLSVKKNRLPYLESRLADLGAFDEESQALILDIRTKVELLNEEVDEARYFFQLTYASGLSEENYRRASQGTENSYRNMAQMARSTIERMNELVNLRSNQPFQGARPERRAPEGCR